MAAQAKTIVAAGANMRLVDFHPTFGGTQGTFDDHANFPPLAAGLFALSPILFT
jgi:hypothetical protein